MAINPLTDFHNLWRIDGAGSPVQDVYGSSRVLTLSSGVTPPRSVSYKRRRGAEFRTTTFDATAPAAFASASASGLNSLLYSSSKITDFTWFGWVRPLRSGLTSGNLTPISGVVSPTNYGSPAKFTRSTVLTALPQASGNGVLYVFVGGHVLDTTQMTQTEGAASTAPISDDGWNAVAVSVDGDAATNNGISSVTVRTLSPTGVRRTYTNAARKAAMRLLFPLTTPLPNDGDTITIDGSAYTWKTTLSGTPATAPIANAGGTNPADGETVTIGGRVYTFRSSLNASGTKATGIIQFNPAVYFENVGGGSGADTTHGETYLRVGGFELYLLYHTAGVKSMPAGYFDTTNTAATTAARVNDLLSSAPTFSSDILQTPATPNRSSPDYTGENGRSWSGRLWNATGVALNGGVWEVTIEATSVGPSEIPLKVIDGWKSGSSGNNNDGPPATWRVRVKSGSVDNPAGPYSSYNPTSGTTQGILKGGVAASGADSVKIGANWAATRASLIHAINGTGTPGTDYANVATPNAICTAATNGANDITLTSKKNGTAGNGDGCSESSTVLTASNFSGGANGTAREVKIGATTAASFENLKSAINDSGGTEGIEYGTGTSAHATVAAESGANITISSTEYGTIILRARTAGAAGNSISVTHSGSYPSAKYDEFCDEVITVLTWGNDAGAWVVGAGFRPDQTDLKAVVGGFLAAPTSSASVFKGTVGDHALLNRTITSAEFAELTTTPPPTSTRDRGWYRGPSRLRVSAKTDRMSGWRAVRALAVGATGARAPLTLHGRRCAVRTWNVEAGCPASVSRLQLAYEKYGGALGGRAGVYDFPGFEGGVDRSTAKENVAPGMAYDLLNESMAHRNARRRRGYRIEASTGDTGTALNGAIYDCTTSTGETRHLFFCNGVIYLLDNGVLTSIDTGWSANEIPTVATVGLKTFICTSTRQRVLIDGTFYTPGISAPTSAPTVVSIDQATSGGVIVTPPGWEYVVTYYDGSHLTDSGPSDPVVVVREDGAFPANVTLGIPVSPSASVTARKVWKRKVGTNTYFYVGTVSNNTSLTYQDTTDDPTDVSLDAVGDLSVTAEFPPVTAVAEHEGRLVGWGDTSDERTIYYSQLGDGERWFPLDTLQAEASVRLTISHAGRQWVLTDNTVEVVDGDWARGSNGLMAISRKVLDSSRGVFGPHAACIGAGRLFWADVSGVHAIGVGEDQRDVGSTISRPVLPFIQSAIDTAGSSVSMAFNHVSQEVWVSLTQANPTDDTKNRIVLTLDVSALGGGVLRWAPYDLPLSFIARMRDGLYGQKFMGVDYLGNALELDVYEGDGIQGNESWFSAAGNSITSIDTATGTLTFTGTSFPTTGLRGVSVVLEDISNPTTPFHRRTILSSTATTLVLDSLPSALVAGDKAHVGGIIGKVETPEVDLGNGEAKKFMAAVLGISDLTSADL